MTLSAGRHPSNVAGFARADLVAVLACLALLIPLFIGVGASTRTTAETVICTDRLRQLQRACSMYAADFREWLPANYGIAETMAGDGAPAGTQMTWAPNVLDWSTQAGNTNHISLGRSPLAPYLRGKLYNFKCPSDRALSAAQRARGFTERIRSFSMNGFMGPNRPGDTANADPAGNTYVTGFRQYHRLVQIKQPDTKYIFLEEHADSINEGFFINNPSITSWGDIPAGRHSSGANISFADGHVILRRWTESAPKSPVRFSYAFRSLQVGSDYRWLVEHSTERP